MMPSNKSFALALLASLTAFGADMACAAENSAAPALASAESALDRLSRETMAVLDKHQAAMVTNDPATIAADYSDDVILALNFLPETLVGKAAQLKFLEELFDPATGRNIFEKILKGVEGKPLEQPKMLRREAIGEYAYLIADLGNAMLTETYVIRDGRILFESVTVLPKTAPAP
jgi:hypothetical protein